MRLRYLFTLALASVLLGSCQKQEIDLFSSDECSVYFRNLHSWSGSTEYYSDSLALSFNNVPPQYTSYVLKTKIYTLGKTAAYDRPVKISIDAARTTAVEGVHFEVALDTVCIKAGESSASVEVRFLRPMDLLKRSVRLGLVLEANEHFSLYGDFKNTNSYTATGKQIDGTRFSFTVSELQTQPSYWSSCTSFFGPWTARKYVALNKLTGWTNQEWSDASWGGSVSIVSGRLSFVAIRFQKYLQEMADAGTPLQEEDGSYIQLPAPYQVDYSKYE